MVLTLLYDPLGHARGMFERCRSSVRAQEAADLRWVVSVQDAHASYDQVLSEMSEQGIALVEHRENVVSLSEHLGVALADVQHESVHILCQDDFYTSSRSAEAIRTALAGHSLLYIQPRLVASSDEGGWDQPSPRRRKAIPARVGPRQRLMARAGVNRVGGLSTIAFGPGFRLEQPLEHDLMVDLELRERLEATLGEPWLLKGGVVSEGTWAGQAQRSMSDVERDEARAWVRSHGGSKPQRFTRAVLAGSMRQQALAEEWAGTATGPAVAAGKLLAPAGDLARKVWRWRRT